MYCVLVVSGKTQSLKGLLKYLPKNMALIVQKLRTKKMSKSVSGYFKTKKKVLFYTKPRPRGGGAKGLSGLSTKKKEIFSKGINIRGINYLIKRIFCHFFSLAKYVIFCLIFSFRSNSINYQSVPWTMVCLYTQFFPSKSVEKMQFYFIFCNIKPEREEQ